jgi:hypothetical protein
MISTDYKDKGREQWPETCQDAVEAASNIAGHTRFDLEEEEE